MSLSLLQPTMNVISTEIPEVLIIDPKIFGDDRGFFFESFNHQAFVEKTGVTAEFVQDNHSKKCATGFALPNAAASR
jgi:dTDP-4-dehydrorhamnose 3,5-epimerase-like enzyme